MKSFSRLLKLLVFVGFVGNAQAALIKYDFSYTFDGFTSIDGVFEGSLAGNILTISDVMATISSTGGTLGVNSFFFDTSLGGFLISGDIDSDPGSLALDGSFFDLAVIALPASNACSSSSGYGFCLLGSFASANIPSANQSYTLIASNFLISEQVTGPTTPAVPAPATLAILGLGLVGLGFVRRKKA